MKGAKSKAASVKEGSPASPKGGPVVASKGTTKWKRWRENKRKDSKAGGENDAEKTAPSDPKLATEPTSHATSQHQAKGEGADSVQKSKERNKKKPMKPPTTSGATKGPQGGPLPTFSPLAGGYLRSGMAIKGRLHW